jgi:pimeloyl-ACP methyl ester carboxylesterase
LGYAPIRRLRLGSDNEPRAYVDQLTGWARTGAWTSRTGTDYMAHLANIDIPVWAVTGDGDRLCLPTDALVMASRLRGARPLRRVGTTAGDALDADHFKLFTKASLAPLWDEMIAFATGSD